MNKLNLGQDLYLKGRIGWRGLSKDEYLKNSNYKIINATSLMDGYIDWDKCGYISEERYNESEEIKLQEKDILISKDGTLGKIGYVKDLSTPCTVASGIFVLRNTMPDTINFDYLYHILKSNIFKNFIERNKAIGSTINHLYQRDLERFKIDLPNLDIQNKVANILNGIENKIENNNKSIIELENLIKMLYDYWFLQYEFLNNENKPYKSSGGKMIYNNELKKEIPDGWVVKKVEDFCKIFTGKKDVNQAIDCGKYKFYSCAPNYKYSNDLLYEGKAILISGNGSYTGRTIFVDDAFDLYQRTYACVEKENNDLLVYIYYSMLKLFIPIVSGGTHGSAIPYIVYDDIAKQKILYSEKIVCKFIKKANPMQEMIINLNKENEELNNLKNYLLPLLMNGQVGFKD